MRKHFIENRQLSIGHQTGISLYYSLILTDRKEQDLFEDETVYSILITQFEKGITTEYEFLYDISRNRETALEILDLLYYNSVMPINSRDVMADYL